MSKAIILFLVFFLVTSCSDKKDPIGKWDDIIKLSTREVKLYAGADSATITTKGNWWWVNRISFDDSTYIYYDNDDVDLESDSYTIVEDDFVVERRDKNTLFVKLGENTTGNERLMKISLEAGDYFDYVNIEQSADQ